MQEVFYKQRKVKPLHKSQQVWLKVTNNNNIIRLVTADKDNKTIEFHHIEIKSAEIDNQSIIIVVKDSEVKIRLIVESGQEFILEQILSVINGKAHNLEEQGTTPSNTPSPGPVIIIENNHSPRLRPNIRPPPIPKIKGAQQQQQPKSKKTQFNQMTTGLQTAISNADVRHAQQYTLNLPTDQIKTILNDIERKDFSQEIKKRWEQRTNKKVTVNKLILDIHKQDQVKRDNTPPPFPKPKVNIQKLDAEQPNKLKVNYNSYKFRFTMELKDKSKINDCMDALKTALEMGFDDQKV